MRQALGEAHQHERDDRFRVELSAAALAVDAATIMMLEAFHNYGQERYLIGKEQDEGSKKQRAAFMLAKWFFDTGDRVGLATSLSVATEELEQLYWPSLKAVPPSFHCYDRSCWSSALGRDGRGSDKRTLALLT